MVVETRGSADWEKARYDCESDGDNAENDKLQHALHCNGTLNFTCSAAEDDDTDENNTSSMELNEIKRHPHAASDDDENDKLDKRMNQPRPPPNNDLTNERKIDKNEKERLSGFHAGYETFKEIVGGYFDGANRVKKVKKRRHEDCDFEKTSNLSGKSAHHDGFPATVAPSLNRPSKSPKKSGEGQSKSIDSKSKKSGEEQSKKSKKTKGSSNDCIAKGQFSQSYLGPDSLKKINSSQLEDHESYFEGLTNEHTDLFIAVTRTVSKKEIGFANNSNISRILKSEKYNAVDVERENTWSLSWKTRALQTTDEIIGENLIADRAERTNREERIENVEIFMNAIDAPIEEISPTTPAGADQLARQPTQILSAVSSFAPSTNPTSHPMLAPSSEPSDARSVKPSLQSSSAPSMLPPENMSDAITLVPSDAPSFPPFSLPSIVPLVLPPVIPSDVQSTGESDMPSSIPSFEIMSNTAWHPISSI